VFIAGHGYNDPRSGYQFLPTNVRAGDSGNWASSSIIKWTTLETAIEAAKGRRLLFVDTCRSGSAYNARLIKDASDGGIVAFSATNMQQDALELPNLGHGVFTSVLVKGLKGAADIKGGVVGVSTFGSESDATVTLALERLGLTRADVTLKEYGGGTRRIEAVKSGEIKATSVNEPVTSMAREQGLHPMVDLAAENIPWLFSGVVVKKDYLEAHRDTLARFLKATVEGNYLARTDARRAKEVLAREARITDPKILDIAYNDFKQQSPPDLVPVRAGADNVIAQFPPDVSRKVEDYVDTSLLDDLRKEEFFMGLEQKYSPH